jgi:RNA polymerase sigma factor (sigma-70 family)
MQTRSDRELLSEYTAHKSETAFGEIVRRYADFVYSAALRQAGNPEQARDVAQTVFIVLARKAGSLSADTVLIGWLCHSARLAALDALRKDHRRQQRERHAMDLLDSTSERADDWNAVRPVLDEAIASLGGEDRDALLLRFFKNESLAAVGNALGVSEDAAQKRVSRALGKLREFLSGRGINTTAAALSVTLSTNAVHAAPLGFAGSLAAGALTKAAAAGSTVPFMKFFSFANTKTTVPFLALSGGLIVLSALQLNARKQLRDARVLAEAQAQTISDLQLAQQPANPPAELEQLRADARDVLRLRAEVTRLQRDLASSRLRAPRPAEARSAEPGASEVARELQPPEVTITARLVSVPATFSQPDGILNEPATYTLFESLRKLDGANFLGQENITTLSGRQAQFQMTPSSDDTNKLFLIDVLAVVDTNSYQIQLDSSFATSAMVDLPVEDRPPGGLSQVRSVQAFTNSTALSDGGTVVFRRSVSANEKWLAAVPGEEITEPRELLILLTATLIDPAGNRLYPQKKSSPNAHSTN